MMATRSPIPTTEPDPVGGMLVNAFDLVRLHMFGELDDDSDLSTPVSKLPSHTAMSDFAAEDERVRATLGDEMLADAQEDFKVEKDWTKKLTYNKRLEVEPTTRNLVLILRNDPWA